MRFSTQFKNAAYAYLGHRTWGAWSLSSTPERPPILYYACPWIHHPPPLPPLSVVYYRKLTIDHDWRGGGTLCHFILTHWINKNLEPNSASSVCKYSHQHENLINYVYRINIYMIKLTWSKQRGIYHTNILKGDFFWIILQFVWFTSYWDPKSRNTFVHK